MGFSAVTALAFGLSMDSFAVSVCKGLCEKKASVRGCLICAVWFGSFQALMTLMGFYLGAAFAQTMRAFDHWASFALLCVIGGNMIREAFAGNDCTDGDLSFKAMLPVAVATSIDALAAGLSLSLTGGFRIIPASGIIGVLAFALSFLGFKIGTYFGSRFEKAAQITGGLILILLGIQILIKHLGGQGL